MGDLCMGTFQEERGMTSAPVPFPLSNLLLPANSNGGLPVYVASADVPGNLYELAMDAIPVFGESFSGNGNDSVYNFSMQQPIGSGFGNSSPLPWQVNLDPALVLCDPLWRHQQRAKLETPAGGVDAAKTHNGGMNSFEERQAALADLVLGRGYNNCSNLLHEQTYEVVQSVLENGNTVQVADHEINSCGVYANANCNGKIPKLEPDGSDNSIYFEHCFAPMLTNCTEASSCSIVQQQGDDKTGGDSTLGCHGGGGWQCAITNQLLGYDSLPDVHTMNGDQAPDSYRLIAMPHTIFQALPPSSQSDSASPSPFALKPNMQHLQHEAQLLTSWPNHLYSSKPFVESLGTPCKEPPAKRLRTSCYTLNDILKNLPRGAHHHPAPLGGMRRSVNIRSNESSPRNICPAPQFSSDVSFSSSRQLSSSSLEKDSDERQSARPAASVEPQSIAARHRRKKISEKIRCLEKLIPGGCKLDTARMLEEAIKYVRFLQAQVHVLECMSYAEPKEQGTTIRPYSAGLLLSVPNSCKDVLRSPNNHNNNRLLDIKGSSSAGAGSCNISWNVRSALAANSLLKKLSAQQMLHILVTSPTLQRKLYTAERCVGTQEQSIMLAAAEPPLSYDLISSADFPSQKG